MGVQCLEEKTLQKIFKGWLSVDEVYSTYPVQSRVVPLTSRRICDPFSTEELTASNNEYRNAMALIYLKTFLGKTANDFEKENFKSEAQRLSQVINSSPRRSELITKLGQIISNGNINIDECLSNPLFAGVFNEKIKDCQLTSEGHSKSTDLLPAQNEEFIEARIHLNPSKKYFAKFMQELQSRCAEQEIDLTAKKAPPTKMQRATDNLAIYTSNENFGKLVNILLEIEKEHPEMTSSFGAITSGMGTLTDNAWFGFSREPQRSSKMGYGLSTANYEVDDLLSYYLVPSLLIRDFDKIIDLSTSQGREIMSSLLASGNTKICRLADSLLNGVNQQRILEQITDLTAVKKISEQETSRSKSVSPEERKGYAPEQIRMAEPTALTDVWALKHRQIKLPDGSTISSAEICDILLKNPTIKKAMQGYYDEHTTEPATFMRSLLKDYMQASTYIDDECFALSEGMKQALKEAGLLVNVRENKQPALQDGLGDFLQIKLGEKAISSLCSDTNDLKTALYEAASQLGIDTSSLDRLENREQIERMYIRIVGIDAIALGRESIKHKEEKGQEKIVHRYENSLQAERQYRGKKLFEEMEDMKSKEARKEFLSALSLHELEDVDTYRGLHKNAEAMAEESAFSMQ